MKYIKIKPFFFIACVVCFISCTGNNSSVTVQEETINEAVYASGEILPDPYVFIQSASNEIISHICVNTGDYVKEGDIVAFLGSSENDQQLTVLRQQLEITKAATNDNSPILNELRQKIDAAKNKYHSDQKNADRYSALACSNAVSQKDAEDYALQAEISRIEYIKVQEQYDAKMIELSGSRLEVESLMAQVNSSKKDKILRSKIRGRVLSIPKKEGESVRPGEIIMLIGNETCFQLKLIIDERDVHQVKPGQKVVFETDAYPNQIFHATLRNIDPLINTELRSIKAEASIDGATFFYPQSTIEANIITREQEKALLIPSDYLFSGDSILVKQGNVIQMKKVIMRSRIGSKVEITDGINEGDVIFKNRS